MADWLPTVERNSDKEETIRAALSSGEIDNHKIDFVPVDSGTYPDKAIVEAALSDADKDLMPYVDSLYAFLEFPLVDDHFDKNDAARDRFEAEVYKKYGDIGHEVINANRMRINRLGKITIILGNLGMMLTDEGKRNWMVALEEVIDKTIHMGEGKYKNSSFEFKRAVMEQYTRVAEVALNVLAGQVPAQEDIEFIKTGWKKDLSQE